MKIGLNTADLTATHRDFGFAAKTGIDEGLPRFVEWYRSYHKL
jgi:UDP-glucuronate 4-epimerase